MCCPGRARPRIREDEGIPMALIKIIIDGREAEVAEDVNLIEAARSLGIHIPHFCYHPGLGVDGNCRMCLVELEGSPKPVIACNTLARDTRNRDGSPRKVFTSSAKAREWQRAVLEFLFLNHPLDCPICDQSGECSLQDFYMLHGQYESRLDLPKVHKRKAVPIGPRVMLDAERCVLCARCVRFCESVTGTGELFIVNRGNRSEITTFPGVPLDNDYSLNTVDLCPVGALTSTDFRFKKRVWLLSSVPSLCAGCARGCNIHLEHDEGIVYRFRPRENMAVNRYWMCDPGRMTKDLLNENRLEVPLRGTRRGLRVGAGAPAGSPEGVGARFSGPGGAAESGEVPFGEALREAADWIRHATAGGAFLLLSPASSTETLFAAKRFVERVLAGASASGAGTRAPGVEDAILRRSDPYPNAAGLRRLELEADPEPELAKGGQLLIVVEDDPLAHRPAWRAHFERFAHVMYLGTNECETSRASDLSLPLTPHSECDGTFLNFEDRIQRFRRGPWPRGDALWGPELLRRLAREAGASFGWAGMKELWNELDSVEPGFAQLEGERP
jgi:NADH-quinone oxidoreductase subunit G